MEKSHLIKRIAEVFPVAPIPSKEAVLYEGAYPGESEHEEIKEFFGGRAWNRITPNDVFNFRHALSSFSPAALAYYTAAWMMCCLMDEKTTDTATEDLVGTLSRADANRWTEEQRRIICEWLAYFKDVPLKKRFEEATKNFGCKGDEG
ncbi:MAG: hypothetical protein ABSA47_18390 [Verrucomicrobiota bacterium]|jgi:hypothetical protein